MIRSLPMVQGPPPPEAPRLKRLSLPQGELAHFYDGPEGLQYVAFAELKPGTVRGNHYHMAKAEGIYLLEGEIRLTVEDIETKARESALLKAGSVVSIPVRIAHTMQPLCPGKAIEFSTARFDPADVCRYPLI